MNSFEKYEDFFPKNVYRSPCVLSAVEKCFENGNILLVKFLNQLNLLIMVTCFPPQKFFVLKLEIKKKIV